MNNDERISILVVDDHTIVRQGLVSLLGSCDDFHVVGEASTGLEAVSQAKECSPAVVLLDLSLPDISGIEVIHQLRQESPQSKVVVLSMHAEPEYVRPAIRAGVSGYLIKGSDVGDLIKALHCAVRGEAMLSPGIARVLLDSAGSTPSDQLSSREHEVLRLVASGKTSREVAVILGISPKTVDNHRHSIMQKLGVHDVVSLTRVAIRDGLVPPG
jgi:DNA-binding NarL/FixJ family response regulator